MFKKIIYILFILIIPLTACTNYNEITKDSNNYPPIGPLTSKDYYEVKLYFPNEENTRLVEENRLVNTENSKLEEIVINELIKGSEKGALGSIMPNGTKLLSVEVIDNVAHVSFSKGIIKSSATEKEEAFVLFSIVNSLDELDKVDKVQIYIEGEIRDVFYNYYGIKEPLTYNPLIVNEDYLEPISEVEEFLKELKNKKYQTAAMHIDISSNDNMSHSEIGLYLENIYKNMSDYEILDYKILDYGEKTTIIVDNRTYYFDGNYRKERTEIYELSYKNGRFKIKNY